MSIKDHTGTNRSFSEISQNGFDRTYVCTNLPEGIKCIRLVDRQTRPNAKTGVSSVLRQAVITTVDAITGESLDTVVNLTIKVKNNDPSPKQLLGFALVTRGINTPDVATMVGTAAETNLGLIGMGVMPTP